MHSDNDRRLIAVQLHKSAFPPYVAVAGRVQSVPLTAIFHRSHKTNGPFVEVDATTSAIARNCWGSDLISVSVGL